MACGGSVRTTEPVILDVRVIPRASKAGIAGTRDGAVLVRLNAPPVDGAANAALIELLAGVLGVPKRAVTISSGERSRTKRVAIAGRSRQEVGRRLQSPEP